MQRRTPRRIRVAVPEVHGPPSTGEILPLLSKGVKGNIPGDFPCKAPRHSRSRRGNFAVTRNYSPIPLEALFSIFCDNLINIYVMKT